MANRVIAIRFRNFMAFEDTGWLELRSINLLFGRNSSGKSVIIRCLRLLKQSMESKSDYGPLVLTAEDGLDLGSFDEICHKSGAKDEGDNIRPCFGFRCSVQASALAEVYDIPLNEINKEEIVDIELMFAKHPKSQDENSIGEFVLSYVTVQLAFEELSTGGGQPLLFLADLEGIDRRQGEWTYACAYKDLYKDDIQAEIWESVKVDTGKGFFPELSRLREAYTDEERSESYEPILFMLERLKQPVEEFLRSIVYVPPLRPIPKRFNLYDERDSMLYRKLLFFQSKDRAIEKMNYWADQLALGRVFSIDTTYSRKGKAVIFEIEVVESYGGVTVNLLDTGFGASQILPVILECLLADDNALIVIEQPELHLHPAAQADVADLFISLIPEQKRFLIETHSEHLLLRLQRRIAETTLANKSNESYHSKLLHKALNLYMIERFNGVSSCSTIELTEWGEYSSQPTLVDFFSKDYDEVMRISEARAAWESEE